MTWHQTLIDIVASNMNIAAPVAAFLGAWLLYGVLGKRLLGADDDFWPRIRSFILPRLDRLAGATPGLYASGKSVRREYVGYHRVDLSNVPDDEDAIDGFERRLVDAGYHRNPMAAFKRNPRGWKADGSWARRYGYIRGLGDAIRRFSGTPGKIPLDPRWLGNIVGRFMQGLGDILAMRQVHLTLYEERLKDDGFVRIHVYAHDEPNSLNPLTALAHYRGRSLSAAKGVRKALDDFQDAGISIVRKDAKND